MNTESGICVDGFKVHCDVIELPSGQYRLDVKTRRDGDQTEGQSVWPIPSGKLFSAQHDAERHAKWILKGIRRVDASGAPQFCLT
ncbi:hypothetical protein [Achromobacter sp. NFACC18-2]|uniref:hypothetical protein n=1 Tax=Achromobacter sp. NFACC18-2 TaxID=1564112 RepID=UPI0008B3C823|nr:hypothetical protein [Achromobacter sp. NFACC18-2]SEK05064.1 hypothetical protein SAMN03159494_04640 [Achromobacter sp. NFACC18-2]